MTSEDDPEARIRELEQPLADAARASEISAIPPPGKWAPPSGPPMPPPPPMAHGGMFPYPQTGPVRQSRAVWILLGLFVIGVIAVPIGIALTSSHQGSRSSRVTLAPTPGASRTSPTSSGIAPNTSATVIPTPSTSLTTAPTGENVTVSGINDIRSIACTGGSVNVSGITNIVTITGHCASVTVSGIQNRITVDLADEIHAAGSGNQVTYHGGSPRVEKSGFDNAVQMG